MKNILGVLFFVTIFTSVLYLAHFIFYDYMARIFMIDSRYKFGLAVFLFVMPVIFILSLFLIHYSGNFLLRAVYYLSGIWHGALVHLLLVIIITWFLIGILKVFGLSLEEKQLRVIAYAGLFLTTAMTLYAIYNMSQVVTKQVQLDKLTVPDSWKGRKVAYFSDVHLGTILRSSHMDKINKRVREISPDIILISGDFFDTIIGNVDYFKDSIRQLEAPLGVYMVSGNHETYLDVNLVKKTLEGTKIQYLEDELVEIDGLQIVGLAYPERYEKKSAYDVISSIETYDRNKPGILLYHEPAQLDDIASVGINLVLAGHTHRGQLWPFNYVTELVYGEYHHGLHRRGDMYLYTSSGAGVWGPNMRSSGKNEVVVIEL